MGQPQNEGWTLVHYWKSGRSHRRAAHYWPHPFDWAQTGQQPSGKDTGIGRRMECAFLHFRSGGSRGYFSYPNPNPRKVYKGEEISVKGLKYCM